MRASSPPAMTAVSTPGSRSKSCYPSPKRWVENSNEKPVCRTSLGRYKLFHRLNEDECGLIERNGEWVRVRKGQTIIAEQRANQCVYIVIEGRVDVRISDSVGTNIDLAAHGTGMMIGEYSFIDGLPAAASVVPATDAVLFAIKHDNLSEILETHDRIGRIVYRNLLGILVQRLRASNAELDLFNA